jgi:L,D-transpeptidase YbiS
MDAAQNDNDSTAGNLPNKSTGQRPPLPAKKRGFRWRALATGLGLGLLLSFITLGAASSMREYLYGVLANYDLPKPSFPGVKITPQVIARIEKRVKAAGNELQRLIPDQPYLIVDTAENRIFLMSGGKLLHEAKCSSGSYVLLKASNNQQWMFSTPRGVFHVLGKHHAPVWRKPDWAFVEEGLPIPHPYAAERYETGVLGEYGIDFGNGYLIHGTLYQRQLGLPVTHGCIRLSDEDLRIVFRNLQLGSKIFIY